MPAVIEVAPTGRAKCRACGQLIAKGERRLGDRVPNPFADEEGALATQWYHLACAAFKRPEPLAEALADNADPIEDRDRLLSEAAIGVTHRRAARVDGASRAPSGRATCRACKTPIEKDTWRIGLVYYEDGRFAPSGYIHARCAAGYFETIEILPRLRHFSSGLAESDFTALADDLRSGG